MLCLSVVQQQCGSSVSGTAGLLCPPAAPATATPSTSHRREMWLQAVTMAAAEDKDKTEPSWGIPVISARGSPDPPTHPSRGTLAPGSLQPDVGPVKGRARPLTEPLPAPSPRQPRSLTAYTAQACS